MAKIGFEFDYTAVSYHKDSILLDDMTPYEWWWSRATDCKNVLCLDIYRKISTQDIPEVSVVQFTIDVYIE